MFPLSWKIIAGLVLALAVSFGLNTCTAKDRNHWREAAKEQERAAVAWKASFTASEARRKTEQQLAVRAINERETACDARVDEARRSARTIRQIVERPVHVDQNNCPVRELVPPGLVRDALQPGPTTGAPRR